MEHSSRTSWQCQKVSDVSYVVSHNQKVFEYDEVGPAMARLVLEMGRSGINFIHDIHTQMGIRADLETNTSYSYTSENESFAITRI